MHAAVLQAQRVTFLRNFARANRLRSRLTMTAVRFIREIRWYRSRGARFPRIRSRARTLSIKSERIQTFTECAAAVARLNDLRHTYLWGALSLTSTRAREMLADSATRSQDIHVRPILVYAAFNWYEKHDLTLTRRTRDSNVIITTSPFVYFDRARNPLRSALNKTRAERNCRRAQENNYQVFTETARRVFIKVTRVPDASWRRESTWESWFGSKCIPAFTAYVHRL